MDGDARPHRAKVTKRYLQQETIERRDWSVKIPDLRDLIPMDLRCDILQRGSFKSTQCAKFPTSGGRCSYWRMIKYSSGWISDANSQLPSKIVVERLFGRKVDILDILLSTIFIITESFAKIKIKCYRFLTSVVFRAGLCLFGVPSLMRLWSLTL